MIVRERPECFVLVRQHDHGLISGEFARYWGEKPHPLGSTLYAIANHDIGWRRLDAEVLWNEEEGRPYSFTDYPVEPKLEAYREGISLVESHDAYAGCLCSMHYARFMEGLRNEPEVRFMREELRRQERLRGGMSAEELGSLEENFRLLRLCDDLSLFVCLNEPGRNEHPWYRRGFRLGERRFEPVWKDEQTVRLVPNPFSDPFGFAVPCELVGKDGRSRGSERVELRVTC